ncbi:MAG: hypothetical protein JXQ84_00340 [Rhodospirillaceae bacterium]|nr:hypothetical protein [Rhodospirillaceae bacterium]
MTDLISRIQDRLSALGLSAHAASMAAFGRGDVIRDILNQRVRHPRSDTLTRLAAILETDEAWLMGRSTSATPTPRDVPVFRANSIPDSPSNATKGTLLLEETAVEYVNRPTGLRNAQGVYAFFITDDGMAPRFETGELVYVSSERPPRVGDYVLAVFRLSPDSQDQSCVARLSARDERTVTLTRFAPPWRETLAHSIILRLHKILTFNDMAGL